MPPSTFISRLPFFSGSRRPGKTAVVTNADDHTLANRPSTPAIPPSAPVPSTGPTAAAIAILEPTPGADPPSVWLTDPTNARITGKELDVAVPTVPYKWPNAETRTSGGLNPIGLIVSSLRRRIAKKPSTSSGLPVLTQSTTVTNTNIDNPPPRTPPVTELLVPESVAANASTSGTVHRERRYRTLGQELRSRFVRTASGVGSATARRVTSFYGLRKKGQNPVGDVEDAEAKSGGIQVRITETSVTVTDAEADTTGQPTHEGERNEKAKDERAKDESGGEVEGGSAPPADTTNAAVVTAPLQGILRTEEFVDPQTEKAREKKISIRFVDPLPRRPDPLPESSKLRINNRRARGRKSTRGIVSAHRFSGWIAEAVLARSKDLTNEQRRAQELHRSLEERQGHVEGDERMVEETKNIDLEGPGSKSQDQVPEADPASPVSPTGEVTGSVLHAEELLDTGSRAQDSRPSYKAPSATFACPLSLIQRVGGPSSTSPSQQSSISDATRSYHLNPVKGAEPSRSRDGIVQVPRTPAPSVCSGVAGVGGAGEDEYVSA